MPRGAKSRTKGNLGGSGPGWSFSSDHLLQGPALTDEQVLKLCRGVITAQLSQYAASIQAKCSQGCPINNRTLIGPPGARGPPGSPGKNVGPKQGGGPGGPNLAEPHLFIPSWSSVHQGKAGKPGAKGARGAQGDRGLEGQEGTSGSRGTVGPLIRTSEEPGCGLTLHRCPSHLWPSTCRSERS